MLKNIISTWVIGIEEIGDNHDNIYSAQLLHLHYHPLHFIHLAGNRASASAP